MDTKEIKKILIDKELSIQDLADKVGHSRPYMSLVINGHYKAKRTWKKIAKALDIELPEAA